MPIGPSVLGCMDDWNSLDHFDPTSAERRQMAHFMYLRRQFNSLQDGFELVLVSNITYQIQLPGSNGTFTEIGLWSVTRSPLQTQANLPNASLPVWMMYTNENQTVTYANPCTSDQWFPSPYMAGTVVQNLFSPFDQITLAPSLKSYYSNGTAPFFGCVSSITMDPYSFRAYVPVADWVNPPPAMTKFSPGHDARIQAEPGDANATSIDIAFEYNTAMDCTWITQNLQMNVSSSGHGGQPNIRTGSVSCQALTDQPVSPLSGDTYSTWRWSGTLDNVADGILELTLANVPVNGDTGSTGVSSRTRACFP